MHCGTERAQVGIGTLIVFTAMVLVATTAAGVLLHTSGYLQSQSEASGEQASAQASDRLQVVSATAPVQWQGDVDPILGCTAKCDKYVLQEIHLTVTKGPGADEISLTNVTIQYVSDRAIVDFVHENRTVDGSSDLILTPKSSADMTFATSAITDDDNSIADSDVLDDADDTATLMLKLETEKFDDDSDPGGIEETGDRDRPKDGTEANLVITTQSGSETTVSISVPEHLADKNDVEL